MNSIYKFIKRGISRFLQGILNGQIRTLPSEFARFCMAASVYILSVRKKNYSFGIFFRSAVGEMPNTFLYVFEKVKTSE